MKRHFCLTLLLSAFLWTGCERGPSLLGRYEGFDAQGQPANLTLVLEADGRGSWSAGDDFVEIRWKASGSQIVMHTKAGGVFTGTVVRPDQISVAHATIGSFEFKKSP